MKRGFLFNWALFLFSGLILLYGMSMVMAGEEGGKIPKLISKVNPQYPAEAKKEGIQGAVIANIIIDAKGAVKSVQVQKSPDERLSKAASEALMQWKYEVTTTPEGKAVEVKATVTIQFRLQ